MLNRIGSGLVMLTLMTVLAAGTSHAVSTMALTGPPGDLAPGSQFSVAVDIDFDQGYDAGASFGGYKQSGFGRELGRQALDYYTESKTVFVGK